jgi:Zn-dependent metalloprotease/subtilisin-like proprotein convertase family protein
MSFRVGRRCLFGGKTALGIPARTAALPGTKTQAIMVPMGVWIGSKTILILFAATLGASALRATASSSAATPPLPESTAGAWRNFENQAQGQWHIRRSAQGLPRMLSGARTKSYGGTPREATQNFAREHQPLFCPPPAGTPALPRTGSTGFMFEKIDDQMPGNAVVELRQTLDGIPVHGAALKLVVDPDGAITHITSTAVPVTDPPAAAQKSAADINTLLAASHTGAFAIVSSEQVVWPGPPARWAYRIFGRQGTRHEPWEYVVDASTAKVLQATRLIKEEALTPSTLSSTPAPPPLEIMGSSTGMVTRTNLVQVLIPNGNGIETNSAITISGLVTNIAVVRIDVSFQCEHTDATELSISLRSPFGNYTTIHPLWQNEEGVNPSRTVTGITTFAGHPVNGIWRLYASDDTPGLYYGKIISWKLTIYYDAVTNLPSPPDTPYTQVFDPNPVNTLNNSTLKDQSDANSAIPTNAYKRVQLTQLDAAIGGRYSLSGRYAVMEDIDFPANTPPTSASREFGYYRNADAFEEVMCYFHITRSQEYIQSLGFLNINNRAQSIDAHGADGVDNSYYMGDPIGAGYMSFGDGGVDDAEDADVILHEYGHSIQDNTTHGGYFGEHDHGYGDETGAMGEGFGDYWASSTFCTQSVASGFSAAKVAEWDGTPGAFPARSVDTAKRYPASMEGEVHADGEIWSACLWDIFKAIGRNKTDKLVLKSHFIVPYAPDFEDGAYAILAADEDLFGGTNRAAIRSAFVKRGILQAQPFIEATPDYLDFGIVPTGTLSNRIFTIRNSGETNLTGDVSVPDPFRVTSATNYNIPAGQSTNIYILYYPRTNGIHIQVATFTGAAGASREIRGSAASNVEDFDKDGMSDWAELVAGTSPVISNSCLKVSSKVEWPSTNRMIISWNSASNRTYHIERSTSPAAGFSSKIATNLPASPPMNSYTDQPPTSAGPYFYRIKVQSP